MRMQSWVLGVGMPAALRLPARLLQPPQWLLQLQPWLPGQELPGALSGREIWVSVCAQVSWGDSAGGFSGYPDLVRKIITDAPVPLAGQRDPSWGV